jgi:hypothetical protein
MANTTIKDAMLLDDPIVQAAMAQARANRVASLKDATFTVEALGGLTLSLKDALIFWQTNKGTSAQLFRDDADREEAVTVRASRELHPQLKALGISLDWKAVFELSQSL